MALTDSMVFHLKCDEAANANFVDAWGGLGFTQTGGNIGTMAGKVGAARVFGASKYGRRAYGSELVLGDIDFTIRFNIRFLSTPSTTVALSWGWLNVGSAARSAIIYWPSATQGRFTMGQAAAAVDCTADQAFANDTWYSVLCEHDAAANTASMYIDNVLPTPAISITGGPNAGSGFVDLGASPDQALYSDIALDEITFWKRKLTSGERATIHAANNAGVGGPFWGESRGGARRVGTRVGVGL